MRWLVLAAVGGCAPGVASTAKDSGTAVTPTSPTSATVDTTLPTTSGTSPTDTGDGCPSVGEDTRAAIVTDIDETLTTSDGEWLTQIVDPFHDPAMRPDANTVMQGYLALGYRVFYLTARGRGLRLLDGTPAQDATEDWLDAHGFPYTSDGVFLADGLGAFGNSAADYKIDILADLQADGFEFAYAYGNADTDIEAFQAVGIPDTNIFLVGKLAGQMGVVGLTDQEAYTDHLPYVAAQGCAPR